MARSAFLKDKPKSTPGSKVKARFRTKDQGSFNPIRNRQPAQCFPLHMGAFQNKIPQLQSRTWPLHSAKWVDWSFSKLNGYGDSVYGGQWRSPGRDRAPDFRIQINAEFQVLQYTTLNSMEEKRQDTNAILKDQADATRRT